MFVLSSDKKKLIQITKAEIVKNMTAKPDEKYAITVSGEHIGSEVVVGLYKCEEDAEKELRKMIFAIENGSKVYEVK